VDLAVNVGFFKLGFDSLQAGEVNIGEDEARHAFIGKCMDRCTPDARCGPWTVLSVWIKSYTEMSRALYTGDESNTVKQLLASIRQRASLGGGLVPAHNVGSHDGASTYVE